MISQFLSDRNWLEFASVLDGVFTGDHSTDKNGLLMHVQALFEQVEKMDGMKDRSGPLALLELERQARLHSRSQGQLSLLYLAHFDTGHRLISHA